MGSPHRDLLQVPWWCLLQFVIILNPPCNNKNLSYFVTIPALPNNGFINLFIIISIYLNYRDYFKMGKTVHAHFLINARFCDEIYKTFEKRSFKFQGFTDSVRFQEKLLEPCQIWKLDEGDLCASENYFCKKCYYNPLLFLKVLKRWCHI